MRRSPGPAADLEQLLESLRAEGDALIGGDISRLEQAVQQKERILRRLAAGLAGAGRSPELREAVAQLRDLNERNARLLAPRIHVNRARIESLFGAIRGSALYSADGRAAQSRPTQRGVRA